MTDHPPPPDADGGRSAPDPAPPAASRVPARSHAVLERPFFWLALMVGGVVLAVSLSFLAEKTDLGGSPGDVGRYCQRVAVIKRTNPLALGAGVLGAAGLTENPGTTGSGVSASGGTDQAVLFVQELTSLEQVAPSNVRDDVREVRLAAESVLAALRTADPSDLSSAGALLTTLRQAEDRSDGAIAQMTEFTQEACGIDLSTAGTSGTTIPAISTVPVPSTPPTTR